MCLELAPPRQSHRLLGLDKAWGGGCGLLLYVIRTPSPGEKG